MGFVHSRRQPSRDSFSGLQASDLFGRRCLSSYSRQGITPGHHLDIHRVTLVASPVGFDSCAKFLTTERPEITKARRAQDKPQTVHT